MKGYMEITDRIAQTLIEASTKFRPDQIDAYKSAIARESNAHSRWVLEKILENSEIAEKTKFPLCDDTGIPHLMIDIGEEAVVPKAFFASVVDGIKKGLQILPGRPMAVKGDDLARISQSDGLYEDPGCLEVAPLHVRNVTGDSIKVTVLMYGGGPEIRGKTQPVFHRHSEEVVLQEMISWAKEGAAALGCQPCVLAFGIGRSNYEAATLVMEAMAEGDFSRQSEIERKITNAVNETGIGPLGLGGDVTALGTFLKVGPQRASGIRVVSLRTGCCFDPRRATVEFKF
jgi:fumarate hydratase subunit alpha